MKPLRSAVKAQPLDVTKSYGVLRRELAAWATSLRRYRYLYLLLIPALAYYFIFHYVPLYGVTLAFKSFQVSRGIIGSPWADPPLRFFTRLLRNPDFSRAFKNTVIISLYKIVFAFPAPVLLALVLNEVRGMGFRRIVQTIVYLPHFISWVIIGGIMVSLLSVQGGVVNTLLGFFGIPPRQYMIDSNHFRLILVGSHIWKEVGWGAIVYLAALAGVDPNLYEAATIDGARRGRMLRSITLPQIRSTIVVMLILTLGQVMNGGFEQVFILYSEPVFDVADILDTFVYRMGIQGMQYSIATAAGLFKSVINLAFIVGGNSIAKRIGEEGVY